MTARRPDPAGAPAPARRATPAVWRLVLGRGDGGGDGDGRAGLDGPTNMAVDQALLDSVKAGGAPALRLYRWSPATLSFGRNQPARGLYDVGAARVRGIGFVRRPTGGQAVLHDDELTYAVVAPVAALGRPRSAYRRINAALVEGLRLLGLSSALAPATRPGLDWGAACFRAPAEGEVVARGRKLVGSAQRTEARVILQHGSILLGGSQAAAETLLVAGGEAGRSVEEGWTTVAAELGSRPGPERLEAAVVRGFEAVLGIGLARHTLTVEEIAAALRLRERYGSDEWTWRR